MLNILLNKDAYAARPENKVNMAQTKITLYIFVFQLIFFLLFEMRISFIFAMQMDSFLLPSSIAIGVISRITNGKLELGEKFNLHYKWCWFNCKKKITVFCVLEPNTWYMINKKKKNKPFRSISALVNFSASIKIATIYSVSGSISIVFLLICR